MMHADAFQIHCETPRQKKLHRQYQKQSSNPSRLSLQISLHDLNDPPSLLAIGSPLDRRILEMPPGHTEENGHVVADEVTPLLANSSTGPTDKVTLLRKPSSTSNRECTSSDEDKPLPKLQIFFLCFARLVDPISFFCIFPFVNQMIYETGKVKEEDVGFYSGLIVLAPSSIPPA